MNKYLVICGIFLLVGCSSPRVKINRYILQQVGLDTTKNNFVTINIFIYSIPMDKHQGYYWYWTTENPPAKFSNVHWLTLKENPIDSVQVINIGDVVIDQNLSGLTISQRQNIQENAGNIH